MIRIRALRFTTVLIGPLLAVVAAGWVLAAPLGTAFTYQGQLRQAGATVNGTCDFQFSLFDALAGGGQVGATQAATGVTLVDGRFTVQLDFGGAAFDGNARWLEIATRCPAGSGGFTTMLPRQPLSPTPYALVAQSAVTAANAWSLAGNAGTTGANFLGTTDNKPVAIRVNGVQAFVAQPSATNPPNVVVGDASNTVVTNALAYGQIVAGGKNNNAGPGNDAAIIGGENNNATQDSSTVVGSQNSTSSSFLGIVLGGLANTASGSSASAVMGGTNNTASGQDATVVGGNASTASGTDAAIVGGNASTASNVQAAVVGGGNNHATGLASAVVGGAGNVASGTSAVISGGASNTASGMNSIALGGAANSTSGLNSIALAGVNNTASGNNSIVGGVSASSNNHLNTFVWADGTVNPFNASADNELSVLATGGIRMLVGVGVGCTMTSSSPTWTCTSDRNAKTNVVPIDGRDVLARLRAIPMQTYTMIGADPSIRHLGPMAQDFYAAFGLGEGDRTIATIDLDGVSLASIQALDRLVQQQDARVSTLESERDGLQARLAAAERERDDLRTRIDGLDARLAALEHAGAGVPAPAGTGPALPMAPAAGAIFLGLVGLLAAPRARRILSQRWERAVYAVPTRLPAPSDPAVSSDREHPQVAERPGEQPRDGRHATPANRSGRRRVGGLKRRRAR